MKQITKPIAVETHSEAEHADVLRRLESMGFKHASGYTHSSMIKSWKEYPLLDICNYNERTYTRNSSPDCFVCLIPASQFLAEYGTEKTEASAAAPAATLNPVNFVVNTGGSAILSRIVQELAFSMGILWPNGDKCVRNVASPYLYMIRREFSYPFESKGIRHSDSPYPTEPADQWPLYSAATQMGEIVRLLSTPVVSSAPPPKPPEIHGYKAVYTAGAPTVNFGCAQIGKNLLRDAAKLMGCVINSDGSVMRDAGIVPEQGCNRAVDSITLSSGKTLSWAQVKEILGYIAAVEEHAKKYPEKS